MEAYVSHRLSVAGNSGGVRFDSGAIDAVTSLSAGLPRLINLLCDRALMAGAQAGSPTIDAAIVHEAGQVLGMTAPGAAARASRRPWHRSLWIVAALLVLLLGGLQVAATQRVDPPAPPAAPPPAPRAAAIQPRPLPDPSELPPDPPAPRAVALPTFGPQ